MKKYFVIGLLSTSMMTSGLQAHYHVPFPTPCQDPGIAYEQSINRARITTAVVVGIAVTAIVVSLLISTTCKHCHSKGKEK